jgi:large subunit ribosomal protein L41
MFFFQHLLKISHSLSNALVRQHYQPSPTPLFQQQQFREMSKYMSKAAKKRIPLNTKRVAKGFYKGKGSTKEGRITRKAKFMVDKFKQLELVVPDLTGFRLKPYIAANASRFPPERRHTPVS